MESQAKASEFGTLAKTGFRKAILQSALITLITWFGGPTPSAAQGPEGDNDRRVSTVKDFLALSVEPIAIGHHGVGPYNPATNPGLPIENTVDSVELAYSLGARVVEIDVQLTEDGKLAVFHNDFLSDFTCIHSLTLDQLQARLPFVPELRQVLDVAHHVNQKAGDDLGGILIVELKAFSPHCDPGDEFEQPLVTATVSEVRQAKMTNQVMFDSFSPALLYLASQLAPEIPRELDLDGLQLLIAGIVTGVRVVGTEMDFLRPAEQQRPGSGAAFVGAAHSLGMRAFADPANSEADWNFFASLGVDAIYSTIPMGVTLQPTIPGT